MQRHLSALSVLALAGMALSQAPLETSLSATNSVVNARGVRVATPRESLPRTGALQATAKLAYAVWAEGSTTSVSVYLARTSDGGVTWATNSVYTTVTGETLSDLKLAASGYAVFVGFLSNRKNPGVARNDVYVIGSGDEGNTFTAATLVNKVTTTAPRGDAQILDVTAGIHQGAARCYLAYEHSPVTAKEDPYFTAVELGGGAVNTVVSEQLLNKLLPAGTNDVDDVAIACSGSTVCVTWRDERGNPSGNNDIYAIVSTQGGADFGSASVQEKKISTNGGLGAVEVPIVAVAGANCYVVWLDNRNDAAGNDDAFLCYSNDAGGTWTEVNLTPSLTRPFDLDTPSIAADGTTVVIAFEDDSRARLLSPAPTDPNAADSAHVIVSRDGGFTRTSTYVSTAPVASNWVRAEQPKVAIRGDYVHVAWEESWYNANGALSDEDVWMSKSYDGGITFTAAVPGTRRGSPARGVGTGGGDIDNPFLAVTGNGEGVVTFLDENPSTSAGLNYAHAVVRGGLEITSKFAGAAGLEIRDAAASQAGLFGIVLLTLDPNPAPLYLPTIFGNDGFEPNLVPDIATNAGLGLLQVFSGFVPAGGGAIPLPLAPDFGGAFTVVAVTLDLGNAKWLSFSPRGAY